MNKTLIAIAGPTCGGKTTLKQYLIRRYPELIGAVITTTTREARQNEIDGSDYHFKTRNEFVEFVEKGAFVEWTEMDGQYYGIQKASVSDTWRNNSLAVAVVTPEGVRALDGWCLDNNAALVRIFASAPIEVLRQRLTERRKIACNAEVIARCESLSKQATTWRRAANYDFIADDVDTASFVGELMTVIS